MTDVTYDLEGRVAVVTGASGGFGGEIVRRLRGSGAVPVLFDLPETLARAPADPGLLSVGVDVTSPGSVEAAMARVRQHHGRLDILVNNAGVVGSVQPTWEVSPDEWNRIIAVNLTGAFLVCRAAISLMLETAGPRGTGRIVNVASIQAKEGMHFAAAYSAAKAGLVSLTKSLGKELATSGILVNAITPAAALTAMSIDAPKERLDDILSRIPMRRFLEPREVAAMVLFLASDECSFSTGAVFDLSGGRATY